MYSLITFQKHYSKHRACTRRCVNATQVKGVDIPEDLTIIVDVLSLHYDAEIWGPVDPHIFYPERLAYEKHTQDI